jgi:hypothetical protein
MHACVRAYRRRGSARPSRSLRAAALGATIAVGSAGALPLRAGATTPVAAIRASAPASSAPKPTSSYYEYGADPSVLASQGSAAGNAGSQGMVILDFGRPAFEGSSYGTIDHSGHFVSLAAVDKAVEAYLKAYYTFSPAYTRLEVAVGTNNSCSTGQPCGDVGCGCKDEPPSFVRWGAALASTVKSLDAWITSLKAGSGYTDDVKVVAADDAEPAYDPGFWNTYDVFKGYAAAVGGFRPAMVDYGSAEPGYWSLEQLFRVAYGFMPDVPFPEIYFPGDVANWTALVNYAKAQHGVVMKIFGVLTDMPNGNSPQDAYEQMTSALGPLGGAAVRWSSNIAPLGSS